MKRRHSRRFPIEEIPVIPAKDRSLSTIIYVKSDGNFTLGRRPANSTLLESYAPRRGGCATLSGAHVGHRGRGGSAPHPSPAGNSLVTSIKANPWVQGNSQIYFWQAAIASSAAQNRWKLYLLMWLLTKSNFLYFTFLTYSLLERIINMKIFHTKAFCTKISLHRKYSRTKSLKQSY